jgi:hypothetical protein
MIAQGAAALMSAAASWAVYRFHELNNRFHYYHLVFPDRSSAP